MAKGGTRIGKPKATDLLTKVASPKSAVAKGSERQFDSELNAENREESESYGKEIVRQEQQETRRVTIGNDQRQTWSRWIIAFIAWMIFSQTAFIALAGSGVLTFTQYPWLLPIYFAQNFAQMVGLAIIVIRSLFVEPK